MYFRCGRRIDFTKCEYGGNVEKLNYFSTERIKKDCDKGTKSSYSINSDHHKIIQTENEFTTKSEYDKKQESNTFGNSIFYRSISKTESDTYPIKERMKNENIAAKAPLATVESLCDTMVLTESVEIDEQVKGSRIHLCCICRSEDESLDQELNRLSLDSKGYCDTPAEAILKASNTASFIATQYVCNDTQIENQEEKKKSRLHNIFDKGQSKRRGSEKKSKSGTTTPIDSDHQEEFEYHKVKKTRNILRRFKKRESENSSLLKPPTAKYGHKQRLGSEPSDASKLTALSMDNVEIIETEYPLCTEVPSFVNDGEVREIWSSYKINFLLHLFSFKNI